MRNPARDEAQNAPDPQPRDPSVREAAAGLLQSARRELAELLELLTLELRYSGMMLVGAAALALLAALAVFSIWGLLVAAAVAWLLASGWSWTAALATLGLVNGLVVITALWLIHRALRHVGIDSTRRALKLEVPDVSA